MAKSRKNIKSMVKSFSNKALPIVNTGLKKTGVAAKTKTSTLKLSKNYVKTYKGQGR